MHYVIVIDRDENNVPLYTDSACVRAVYWNRARLQIVIIPCGSAIIAIAYPPHVAHTWRIPFHRYYAIALGRCYRHVPPQRCQGLPSVVLAPPVTCPAAPLRALSAAYSRWWPLLRVPNTAPSTTMEPSPPRETMMRTGRARLSSRYAENR